MEAVEGIHGKRGQGQEKGYLMTHHVYIEYPKALYNNHGVTMVVDNREEEDAAIEMGWMSAAKYFKYGEDEESAASKPEEPTKKRKATERGA